MIHPRRLLPLGAGLLVLAAAPAADAAVRSSVTVHNQGASALTWSLKVKLAKGARLQSANGFALSRRTGTVTLTPQAKRSLAAGATRSLTVTSTGRRMPRFSVAGRACTVQQRTVRCTLGRKAAAGAPSSTAPAAGTPAAPTPAPAGGGATTGTPPAQNGSPTGSENTGGGDPPVRRWPAFAPYVDVSVFPAPDWQAIAQDGDVAAISLGFVVAEGGNQCVPTWGGFAGYPAYDPAGSDLPYELAGIQRFEPVPSFGGAAGAELATVCSTAADLAAAYQKVIDAYDVTHVDFDIEGAAVNNTVANARRVAAIKLVQDAAQAEGRTLRVSYTVASIPGGLEAKDHDLVKAVVDAGIDLSLVNVMAMNLGSTAESVGLITGVAVNTRDDLTDVFGGLTPEQRMTRVGLTPMVGRNDTTSEVVTVAEAQGIATWASANHPGMIGMWSLGRDRQCDDHPRAADLPPMSNCSDVAQSDWAFSHAFGQFTG
jgi:hypothetical protein